MEKRSQRPAPKAATPLRSGVAARSGAELDQLARLAGVGELLAEVVHEVRNGLVSIKTFVQLLPEHRDDPEFEILFRDITGNEFERIERLLSTVLDQASGGPSVSTPGTSDPSAAIESVVTLAALRANKQGIGLVAAPGDNALLGIDGDALRQVLLNLILNALSASGRGDEVQVERERRGALFEIRIHDQGPGVRRGERDRIFEPFFTTRSHSAGGLGLAISRRLVENAGGTLTVRERAGGGSTFRIRLPLSDEVEDL